MKKGRKMNKAWNDFVAGWREVQWINRFSLYLLPLAAGAVPLAHALGWRFTDPPRDTPVLIILLAGWGAILLATRRSQEDQDSISRTEHQKVKNASDVSTD
jgi:hypothetical protein